MRQRPAAGSARRVVEILVLRFQEPEVDLIERVAEHLLGVSSPLGTATVPNRSGLVLLESARGTRLPAQFADARRGATCRLG